MADAEPPYRLVTTILDEAQAPAADLVPLHRERWKIEGVLAELKTHLRGVQVVLRSRTANLVRQEFAHPTRTIWIDAAAAVWITR